MKIRTALKIYYNTGTMVFETSEEAKTFFNKFHDRIPCFVSLDDKHLYSKFQIEPSENKLSFIWIFEDRDDYIKFIDELRQSKFFNLINQLGWKLISMGSSEL